MAINNWRIQFDKYVEALHIVLLSEANAVNSYWDFFFL